MANSFISRFAKIHKDAILPTIATKGSVGYDIYALEDTWIEPGEVKLIRTGLVAIPPDGFHFELVLRSSTPLKKEGLVLANSLGIIDRDYIGADDEIKIMILNTKKRRMNIDSNYDICGRFHTFEDKNNDEFELSIEEDFDDSSNDFYIKKGEKIAQLILRQSIVAPIQEIPISHLKNKKNRKGFGHSGD